MVHGATLIVPCTPFSYEQPNSSGCVSVSCLSIAGSRLSAMGSQNPGRTCQEELIELGRKLV